MGHRPGGVCVGETMAQWPGIKAKYNVENTAPQACPSLWTHIQSTLLERRTAQDARTATRPLRLYGTARSTHVPTKHKLPPKGYTHVLTSPGEISPKVFLPGAQARLRPPPESPFHNKNPSPGYAGTSHPHARGVGSVLRREEPCCLVASDVEIAGRYVDAAAGGRR